MTFFTEEDTPQLRSIANIIKAAGGDVPDWIMTIKKGQRPPRQKKQVRADGRGVRRPGERGGGGGRVRLPGSHACGPR